MTDMSRILPVVSADVFGRSKDRPYVRGPVFFGRSEDRPYVRRPGLQTGLGLLTLVASTVIPFPAERSKAGRYDADDRSALEIPGRPIRRISASKRGSSWSGLNIGSVWSQTTQLKRSSTAVVRLAIASSFRPVPT